MCPHAICSLSFAIWPILEAKLGMHCYKQPSVCPWLKLRWSEKAWYGVLWLNPRISKRILQNLYSLDKWRQGMRTQPNVIIVFFTLVLQGWGESTLSQLGSCQNHWSCTEVSRIPTTFVCYGGSSVIGTQIEKSCWMGSHIAAQAQGSVKHLRVLNSSYIQCEWVKKI